MYEYGMNKSFEECKVKAAVSVLGVFRILCIGYYDIAVFSFLRSRV